MVYELSLFKSTQNKLVLNVLRPKHFKAPLDLFFDRRGFTLRMTKPPFGA